MKSRYHANDKRSIEQESTYRAARVVSTKPKLRQDQQFYSIAPGSTFTATPTQLLPPGQRVDESDEPVAVPKRRQESTTKSLIGGNDIKTNSTSIPAPYKHPHGVEQVLARNTGSSRSVASSSNGSCISRRSHRPMPVERMESFASCSTAKELEWLYMTAAAAAAAAAARTPATGKAKRPKKNRKTTQKSNITDENDRSIATNKKKKKKTTKRSTNTTTSMQASCTTPPPTSSDEEDDDAKKKMKNQIVLEHDTTMSQVQQPCNNSIPPAPWLMRNTTQSSARRLLMMAAQQPLQQQQSASSLWSSGSSLRGGGGGSPWNSTRSLLSSCSGTSTPSCSKFPHAWMDDLYLLRPQNPVADQLKRQMSSEAAKILTPKTNGDNDNKSHMHHDDDNWEIPWVPPPYGESGVVPGNANPTKNSSFRPYHRPSM